MKILSIEGLYKSYGDKVLLDEISFAISEKDKVGLIGINGTGKSTLLRIIAGLDTGEKGIVSHPNDYHIEYLAQNPSLDDNLTVLEQVFYGNSAIMKLFRKYEITLNQLQLDPENSGKQKQLFALQQEMDALNAWEANSQAKIILNKLGIANYDDKIKYLSGGQRKRIALAQALIHEADLLILDEPTNHIDNNTVIWLEEYLAKYSGAVLLVTHDRYFLDRVINNIIELDKGKIYRYDGNFEYYLEKKLEREEDEEIAENKKQNLLRRELAWLHRGAKARTTKQKARIDRVQDLNDQKISTSNESLELSFKSARIGKKILEITDLTMSFGEKKLFKHFNFLIGPKDRIGIIGPNGVGKTTLLNLLAGKINPDSGNIAIGQTIKIGYYKQENINMDENMRVIDYIKEKSNIIQTNEGKTLTPSQMLEKFLFTKDLQWSLIGKLSGGERRRLYLLGILIEEPNVIFLDEPTNDLDLQTLNVLEDYLEQFEGVVITVSHDRYFLDKTIKQLLILDQQGIISHFYGNYSDYLEALNEKETENEVSSKNNKENPTNSKTNKLKLSYKEQKEWEEIEQVIATIEKKINQLQNEIDLSGSDYEKIEKLFKEKEDLSLELEKKLERWTEFSEIIEEIEQNKTQDN